MYVTVLDFRIGKVYIYEYSEDIDDIEDFIANKNHKVSDCQYMCTENLQLEIN